MRALDARIRLLRGDIRSRPEAREVDLARHQVLEPLLIGFRDVHADPDRFAADHRQVLLQRVQNRPELPHHRGRLVRGIDAERKGQVGLRRRGPGRGQNNRQPDEEFRQESHDVIPLVAFRAGSPRSSANR